MFIFTFYFILTFQNPVWQNASREMNPLLSDHQVLLQSRQQNDELPRGSAYRADESSSNELQQPKASRRKRENGIKHLQIFKKITTLHYQTSFQLYTLWLSIEFK